jgi:hypothetical protein
MSDGSITLADIAAGTDTLILACTRCERVGQYSVDKLIINHGQRFGIPLLTKLSAECPRRQSVSAYGLCGIRAPELSALFLTRAG